MQYLEVSCAVRRIYKLLGFKGLIVLFCVLFVLFCVLFVLFCVLFVCKCVQYSCHRVPIKMQLTNISI